MKEGTKGSRDSATRFGQVSSGFSAESSGIAARNRLARELQ
jgi:hypothetical protein